MTLPFEEAPAAAKIPDYTTVAGLGHDFETLAAAIRDALAHRDTHAAVYKELSARADVYLRAVGAPKSIGALGLRFTQTDPRKASSKTDLDALRMELEKRLDVPIAAFAAAWTAALEVATVKGEAGKPGLTIAALKDEVSA